MSIYLIVSDRLALMLFYPEGLFGTLLARHREMGEGVRRGRREGLSEEVMWRRGRRGWTEENGRDG